MTTTTIMQRMTNPAGAITTAIMYNRENAKINR